MSIINYSDPLFIDYHTDPDTGDKITISRSNEPHIVTNAMFMLDYIPNEFNHTQIYNGVTLLTEIKLSQQITSATEYKVDYTIGKVYVHTSLEAVGLVCSYYSRGIIYYPSSRVMYDNDPGFTIKDKIDLIDSTATDKTVTFHNATITTGNGTITSVDGLKNLVLSCSGTNSSITIELHVIDSNQVDNIIPGFSVVDFSQHNTITSKNLSYFYSVEGMVSVYAKITSISGGSATITGQLTESMPNISATFHNTAVATGDGNIIPVNGLKNLCLSCSGTNTSREIEVHAVDSNLVDNIIPGFSVLDFSQHNTITSKNSSYFYSVEGMVSVYAKITTLGGGNATISGMLTA